MLNSIKSPAIEMINDIETGLESFRMQGVSINEEHMHDMQQLLLGNSNIKAKQEEYKMNLIRYSFADIVSICNISRCTFPNEPRPTSSAKETITVLSFWLHSSTRLQLQPLVSTSLQVGSHLFPRSL